MTVYNTAFRQRLLFVKNLNTAIICNLLSYFCVEFSAMRRFIYLSLLILFPAFQSFAGNPTLQVINASSDPFMGLAKVELGDSVLIDTIRLNNGTAYLEVPAAMGQTLRFTALLDTSAVLELTGLDFEEDKMYQSILFGVRNDANYYPNPDGRSLLLDATFREVDTSGIASGSVRTDFFHAVGDAVGMDVADLLFEYIVDDMYFGEYSSTSTDLPADLRSLFFTSTDSVVVIASRSVDLEQITGNSITIFLTGFIVPINNNNGPVLGFYGIDQAGNVIELGFVLSTPLDEILTDLRIYPNPASESIALDFYYDSSERLDLYFTDLSGRLFFEEELRIYPGNNEHRIQLPELANGLYLLYLSDGRQQKSVPVVIVR